MSEAQQTPIKQPLISFRELIGCLTIAPGVGMIADAPHWALPLFAMGAISAWGFFPVTADCGNW